jgi:predicted nuclease of predicted toxin-antitoxin system
VNSPPKPREDVVFFLDRTLGRKIFSGKLREKGLHVEVHDDHFATDARDAEWLAEVGARGWVVVTSDQRIRYRQNELGALLRHRVKAFAFTQGNLTAEEMAEIFLKALPKILRLVKKSHEPFIASISRGGGVRVLLSRK